MNFEQLLSKEKSKLIKIKKKKTKKFFEFNIENINFYDLLLFQHISVKIINVPFEDKSISASDLNPEKSFDYRDFFILLLIFIISYFFIVEFITIWYKENIIETGITSTDKDFVNDVISSILFSNYSFSKTLTNVNVLFNSSMIDFLNIYGHLT